MSARDPYITSPNPNIHLRDARHAHQFYTDHGHLFAPKTKFLYHVVFQPNTGVDAVGTSSSSNSIKFQKEIGVLAKSVELPQYRASVDTKQQYNRKKNIQTRIDYQEVTIRFHDDNGGVTRSLLEEYYRYYIADARYDENSNAFGPRDKYEMNNMYKYGLDNDKKKMFFSYIKIYQLSKQRWFSYALINPIITQWGHDTLEASDGSGMMENVISIAYESVAYDHGDIGADTPTGFTDPETRYDTVNSPLALPSSSGSINERAVPNLNVRDDVTPPIGILGRLQNQSEEIPTSNIIDSNRQFSVLQEYALPGRSNQRAVENAQSSRTSSDPNEVIRKLDSNPSAKQSFFARTLNSGEVDEVDYASFSQTDEETKTSIENRLKDSIRSGAKKIASFAQEAIDKSENN